MAGTQPAANAPATIEVRGLIKEYRRGTPVLRGVSIAFPDRGITAVIGPSGTGKSTLIRCINRLVEPTAGEILFHGVDLVRLSRKALRQQRRRIGMVFQEYNLRRTADRNGERAVGATGLPVFVQGFSASLSAAG